MAPMTPEKPSRPVAAEAEPLHQDIHLRVNGNYQRYFAHIYSLHSSITLILVSKTEPAANAKDDELKSLDGIRAGLERELRGYFPYLITKHRTHLVPNITKFVHKLPGLVHFIFVERTSDRVVAPTITALQGKKFSGTLEQTKIKTHMLKRKVWATVFCGQAALCNGYTSMLMGAGDFQYSYRLWFVDDGQEVPLPDIPLQHNPRGKQLRIHTTFYKDLTKRLFPSKSRIKAFELFALYVSGVSAATVNSHNAALVASLLH